MTDAVTDAVQPLRADARRNQATLLTAAAEVFATSGVEAPVRTIAAHAGVGTGTIYRHFPTRADLVAAVYHHQVEECAEAGPRLLAEAPTAYDALLAWVDRLVGFLATKHGLAAAMGSDTSGAAALHTHLRDRLVPVGADLLDAARASGQVAATVEALPLLRAVGNLCIGGGDDPTYDARRMVRLLLAGLRAPEA